MKIMIMDGQGGGVGKVLVEKIAAACPEAEIVAVGTNALATANMLKGGKVIGATGENAVVYNSQKVDVIAGPMGILLSNAMYGEITPKMAQAVAESEAKVLLVPMAKCHAKVVGVEDKKLADYIDEVVGEIRNRKL